MSMWSKPWRQQGWSQALIGATLTIAVLGGLGYMYSRASSENALKHSIERAMAARNGKDAEAGLRRWLLKHPRDGDAWEMLGSVLFDQGRGRDSATALRNVRDSDRGWAHAQQLIGEIAVADRNLAEAERSFRRAAERDPRPVEPLKRLSSLLVLERRPAEARSVLRRLFRITRDPRYLADSILISQIEYEFRDLGPEVEAFLRRTPDDPWLRRVCGLYLFSQGRSAEALPHLEFAASAFDEDPMGRFALVECRMSQGISQDDLSVLGARPSRSVEAARWAVLQSRLAEAWSRDDDALSCLRSAISDNPRNSEAHYRLGQALVRRGDRDGGRVHLERGQALGILEDNLRRELRRAVRNRLDSDSLSRLGQLCQEAGMSTEARDWFELALEREPANKRAASARLRLAPPRSDEDPPFALSLPVLRASTSSARSARGPRVTSAPDDGPRFTDVAEQAGVRFRYNSGATSKLFIADTMGGGVGLIDFDGDGWLDIYFVNGCPLPYDRQSPPRPNKLYRNRADGTFEDVTEQAGVPGNGYGMGCAVGDFDNDGYDDLLVTGLSNTVLYRNRGDGTFDDATVRSGVVSTRWTTAAGFGDLDGDGDLDLVVVAYVQADPENVFECRDKAGRPIHCQPERFAAQFDHLFRNNGDGTFTDASRESGLEIEDGRGLGLAIADFDADGRLDLFVANDGTPNFLFRNRGALRFDEVGLTAGVAYDSVGHPTASMGVVADDLNGDGRIDLFHTNFVDQTNTLRLNLGHGQFVDGTLAANLAAPSRSKTGFGTVAIDANNDGAVDLFVANGHTDEQPWFNTPMAETPQLFLSRGDGRFDLAGPDVSPYFSRPVVGRGVAAGDLDNDGRVDLVVVHRNAPAVLLRNCSRGNHWLGLRLRGSRGSRTPVGARVVCRAGGHTQTHWLTAGTSYLSAGDARLWFGLGSARVVEQLEIHWASGTVQTWSDLPVDRALDVREGNSPIDLWVGSRHASPDAL